MALLEPPQFTRRVVVALLGPPQFTRRAAVVLKLPETTSHISDYLPFSFEIDSFSRTLEHVILVWLSIPE